MKMFGEYLRELRETNNLPLRKVAAALDIDTSVLSKIERGERSANRQIVEAIAAFFSLELKKLLTEYYSDQVAQVIFREDQVSEILKIAESKVNYLRQKRNVQGNIQFNDE